MMSATMSATTTTATIDQNDLAMMTALKKHNFDASKCVRETELLDKCTSMHAKAPKVKNTINYHLQRLARLARVAR